MDFAQFTLSFDILNRSRPFALSNDIGAHECHDSSLLSINLPEVDTTPEFIILPANQQGKLRLQFTLYAASFVKISLFTINGQLLSILTDGYFPPGKHIKEVETRDLTSGVYVFHFNAGTDSLSIKYHLFR